MSRRRKQRQNQASAASSNGAAGATPGGRSLGSKLSATKWLVRGVSVLSLLLVVASIVGYFWIRGYLRSPAFRDELARQIGGAVAGTASLEPLDWQGAAVATPTVGLSGPSFGDWTASEVEAVFDLSGVWRRIWLIESLTISRAEAHWGAIAPIDEFSPPPVPVDQAKPSSRSRGGFLPNRSEISRLAIRDFSGSYQNGEHSYRWESVSLDAIPREKSLDIKFVGGTVATPVEKLGKLRLQEATLRKNGEDLFLTQSRWRLLEGGRLEVHGSRTEQRILLEGELKNLALDSLLSPDWQQKVSGEIASELFFQKPEGGEPRLSGATVISDATIGALPILNRLASYSANPRLLRLSLEQCRADVTWQAGGWQLANLLLEDEGLLRIEGGLALQGEALSGELRVGVPPGLLANIPGAEEKVFFAGERGLLWAPVQVSGTLANPQEDLSARMIRAAQERMFELVPETGAWALRYGASTLDEGTQALLSGQGIILQKSTQAATQAVQQGTRLVEEGVGTGFGILKGILGESGRSERAEEEEK